MTGKLLGTAYQNMGEKESKQKLENAWKKDATDKHLLSLSCITNHQKGTAVKSQTF